MNREKPFWIADNFVDPQLNQITSHGKVHKVEHQVMQVLLCLAEHSQETLTREQITDSVWLKGNPNDEGLTQAISKLRRILNDEPSAGSVIQTIRKVGYRLVVPVVTEDARGLGHNQRPQRSIRIRIEASWLAVATILFVGVALLFRAS